MKIKRSARDIIKLAVAVESLSIDYGPMAPYPDFAYETEASRRKFGIVAGVPQDLVDRLAALGPGDPSVYAALQQTKWKDRYPDFSLRINGWRRLVWPSAQLPLAEMMLDRKMSSVEVQAEWRRRAEGEGLRTQAYCQKMAREYTIPSDPFAQFRGNALYRYGRSSAGDSGYACPFCWVIAGNGPDRDADLDVKRFDQDFVQNSFEIIDPNFCLGRNPIELLYDPTNGLKSDGDMFLLYRHGSRKSKLGNLRSFLQRYGVSPDYLPKDRLR